MRQTLDLRLGGDRGQPVEIFVDGERVLAFAGETVAGALLAAGRAFSRRTANRGQARGYYCGMGVCWDCALIVDGHPNVRACMTPVRKGLRVETQVGFGPTRAT